MAPEKKFFLAADQIRRDLAPGHGGCLATDEITIRGRGVGYMYRENPDRELDSGWRFFSGTESQEYVDNPQNVAIYDVNTIANYAPDIIPYLDAAFGSAFERGEDGQFQPVKPPDDPDADQQ